MTNALVTPLAARTTGQVFAPTGAGHSDRLGYDHERSGFNTALDHRPGLVLAAETTADIVAGVRFAADNALAVDIQATGHGAHRAMDGGLLITTRRLRDVAVDPSTRTARVAAGATAGDVIAAVTAYGLAAPVGAAPGVGYVSYSLGGGLGLLGRKHGWAADHIRRLWVATADGRTLEVSRDGEPELFWALRGGGGNLAAVTEIEIDLMPVRHVYGGGLFVAGEHAIDVMALFRQCSATAPDGLSLSVAFVAIPDLPVLPAPIRGRFCGHIRVTALDGAETTGATEAASGIDAAQRAIAPLRGLPLLLDTCRQFSFTEIGTVHADPVGPLPVHSDSAAMRSGAFIDDIVDQLDPSAPFMLEVRHLGGALAEAPAVANAVGH